ncbi:hypothetical protein Q5752_000915 [Cryptotrichosporon argae]
MAYGAIAAPKLAEPLPVISYTLPDAVLTTHAVHGADVNAGVVAFFHAVFNEELAEGKTYPQQGPMSLDAFTAYFFASTTIVAILAPPSADVSKIQTLEDAVAGRPWADCLGGCYYVKPNYPGRSSHNCNAGFLVPPLQRGRKIGGALAQSYLEYAPRLGYRGSVFNLVYKNNAASLRLWDKLGFTRVGVIPQAGLLKTGPGGAEEYVDAVVVYKSFV